MNEFDGALGRDPGRRLRRGDCDLLPQGALKPLTSNSSDAPHMEAFRRSSVENYVETSPKALYHARSSDGMKNVAKAATIPVVMLAITAIRGYPQKNTQVRNNPLTTPKSIQPTAGAMNPNTTNRARARRLLSRPRSATVDSTKKIVVIPPESAPAPIECMKTWEVYSNENIR